MLAVIGPTWITAVGAGGKRRLDSEGDYVRRELAAALARGIEVLPVLVAGAQVPSEDELPEELKALARRHMYVLNHAAYDADMARLIRAVERSAARTREMRRLSARPKSQFGKRRWARLLLLHEPVRPGAWVLHILFFAILVLSIYTPLVMWIAKGSVASAVAVLAGLLCLLLLIRGVVLLIEPDPVVSPLRRWLLYNPPASRSGQCI